MKKLLVILLTFVMVVSMTACGGTTSSDGSNEKWKVGVVTGTVSQNEEEYRAAQNVLKKYGEDHIVTITYPDKFMDEQETLIANVSSLAADPDIKAIVMCQAVPGTSAAIDKIKELRDDILFIAATSGEDPPMIAERADMVLMIDDPGTGRTIAQQAHKQGAKTILHYSFPRHMSYAQILQRRDIMKEEAEKLGMKFVDVTAPDPTGDAGTAGAQQFVLEDIPKQVEKYGKDTAFFSTNCAMQIPMIQAVLEEGAIYPQPCCPSPFHGFPSACAIEVPEDKAGDIDYMIEETKKIVAEKNATGRVSTWPVPVNMMFVETGVEYAKDWILNGCKEEEKSNVDKIKEYFTEYAGVDVSLRTYDENGTKYDNFVMVLMEYLNY